VNRLVQMVVGGVLVEEVGQVAVGAGVAVEHGRRGVVESLGQPGGVDSLRVGLDRALGAASAVANADGHRVGHGQRPERPEQVAAGPWTLLRDRHQAAQITVAEMPDEIRRKLPNEVVDELLAGARTEEEIVGPGGVLSQLTNLRERA